MAIQTEPTRIQIPFADSGTKNVIPDTNSTPSASQAASWTDGFPAQCSLPLSAGGIPPARADFNGILNAMTQSERFTQEGGVWAWNATVDYAANRVVLGSDGLLYWSVAQSGPNVGGAQDPTADDGTYWQAMPMNDAEVVHKTGAETISGVKTFSTTLKVLGEKAGIDPSTGLNGINNSDNDAELILWSGGNSASTQGAKLALAGLSYASNPGSVNAIARNSSSQSFFTVFPDGKAQYDYGYNPTYILKNRYSDKSTSFSGVVGTFSICDKNDGVTTSLSQYAGNSGASALSELDFVVNSFEGSSASVQMALRIHATYGPMLLPVPDNAVTLGDGSHHWKQLYASTATINTSDARLKTEPEAVPDEVLDAWGEVGFVQFQMLDSVAEKGADKARLHNGLIAQRIDEAFKAHGLDASRYGLFCYDAWDEEPERIGEDGIVEREAIPAGNRYSLRYEEALCMEAAFQRRRADRAEARLAALEERLAAIEAKLG